MTKADPLASDSHTCQRCGCRMALSHNTYPKICEDCYSLAGACCQEREEGQAEGQSLPRCQGGQTDGDPPERGTTIS